MLQTIENVENSVHKDEIQLYRYRHRDKGVEIQAERQIGKIQWIPEGKFYRFKHLSIPRLQTSGV